MKSGIFKIDWLVVFIYILLVGIGWVCIYATGFSPEREGIFDFSQFHGKQLIFIGLSFVLGILILSVEGRFFEKYSSIFYVVSIVLLAGLFLFGKKINGATAWYSIGSITVQPAEFAKAATALVFAKQLSAIQLDIRNLEDLLKIIAIVALPCGLIILQPDPGSVLVYGAFIFILYREGMQPVYLFMLFLLASLFVATLKFGVGSTIVVFIFLTLLYGYWVKQKTKRIPIKEMFILVAICVFVSFSTSLVFEKVFKQHHRDRFSLWLRLENDPVRLAEIRRSIGYNTLQSESAITSGKLQGKGFLEGTRTKGQFVPEQHTDYIFTTLGEEWGFYGTAFVVVLFTILLLRLWYLAERQRNTFSRVYGYCVVAIFFVHFFVNIGMTIGLLPTIGIPLPFFSYGGSGLMGFTILLFVFLQLDANRNNDWMY